MGELILAWGCRGCKGEGVGRLGSREGEGIGWDWGGSRDWDWRRVIELGNGLRRSWLRRSRLRRRRRSWLGRGRSWSVKPLGRRRIVGLDLRLRVLLLRLE